MQKVPSNTIFDPEEEKSKLSLDLKNTVNQAFLSKYITTREKSKEKSKSAESTFECSFCDGKFVKSSLKKHVKMARGKNSGHVCEL